MSALGNEWTYRTAIDMLLYTPIGERVQCTRRCPLWAKGGHVDQSHSHLLFSRRYPSSSEDIRRG
jgi:hypothetical protein